MKFMPVIFTVAISATLALTGCSSTPAPAAPSYTPATITTPSPAASPVTPSPAPGVPMDHITAPSPSAAPQAAPNSNSSEPLAKVSSPENSSVHTIATRCEEDEPCWDCATMGNKICGNMTPAQEPTNIPLPKTSKPWGYDCDTEGYKVCKATPNLGDAWESFDAATPAPYYDHKTMLVYERTTHTLPTQLNNAYVVIKSTNLPKTWHIFHYAPVPATH